MFVWGTLRVQRWKNDLAVVFLGFMPLRGAGCIMEFHFVNLRAQAPPLYEYRLGDPVGLRKPFGRIVYFSYGVENTNGTDVPSVWEVDSG